MQSRRLPLGVVALITLGLAASVACGSSQGSSDGGHQQQPDGTSGATEVSPPEDATLSADVATDGIGVDLSSCVELLTRGPGLVCFGSDPGPYQMYLVGGAASMVGTCPMMQDFLHPQGQGSIGYASCGPVPAPADAAASTDGGTSSCCFWVLRVQGA